MPLEIGKLTCLRTLEIFIVGNEEGRKIGELGNLKNLQGELTITNLEKVRGKAEAMGACLVEKQNLNFLEFEWSEPGKREGDNNDDEEVLEGLQPHQNLKRLAITYFYGDKFPAWTMKMNFPKLVEIFLKDCYKCQEMPTLGHLPLLKILKVYELRSVTSIGPSFYHEEHSSRAGVPFPALERFELHEMDSLTEWVEAGATAFPKLEFLEIWSCRELMTAPSHAFPSLRTLRIRNVWSEVPVTTICSNSSSLEELYIYDNSNLTSLPYKLFHNNQCLQSIEIQSCYNLRQVELSDALIKSLGELKIITCSNLASIQCQTTDYPISRLSNLEIIGCPMLAGFVSEMLLKKRTLSMENPGFWMNRLKRLDIDSFSEETVVNETLKGLREIHSLRELRLTGMRDWECLPDQLQHLTSLTHLTLVEFGIEALPQWFSNLSSLNYLCVLSCEKLMDLTCLQFLTELKTLDIWDCRLLGEALNYRSRAAHISHIPNISVDWMFTLYDV
ncbi:putative disease resistance protein RGA3 [Henckelia pumila]|uniref:putative disease resistance protein RGA3 n=1 Tax=Henckelia pumila TaxID=405737 RepID=UPI003C6E7084